MAKGVTYRPFMGSRYVRASQSGSTQALQAQFRANLGAILKDLKEFTDDVKGFIPSVAIDVLEPTFGKALEYCPEDTGDLRASGYLEEETRRGHTQVAIGFGKGGKPDYAIYVHELPYAHEAPTRYKFLEAALDEDYFSIVNAIPRLIRERAGT